MSLVAWYPLIDGSLENKGLDTTPLTVNGSVPFENARVRTAPRFNGVAGNYLVRPSFLTKDNNFSVSLWIKRANTARGQVFYQVRSTATSEFTLTNGTNYIAFTFVGNVFDTGIRDTDVWHHIAITIDENKIVRGYTDGVLVFTSTSAITFIPNNMSFIIGGVSTEYFNGQIQDFRYYDHCLSPKEVKEIAKGLCLHLPLKGTNARPNLFKNSATMFNSTGLAPISTTCTSSTTLVFDENAPCGVNGKILRATVNRPDNTVSDTGGYFYNTAIPTLTIGQKYCVSIWARCTANNVSLAVGSFMEGHTPVKGSVNRTLTSEWKRYYAIFTATKTGSTTCFYIKAPIGASGTLEYCCPKLELLSPTPYIPNVDDTQYSDYVLDYEPDCSGNEFDATKYGDLTTSDSNGRYNTAVAFNGTNTFLQGLAPTNSECKEFTIATWVKLNNNTLNPAIYNCRTVSRHGINLIYRGNSSPTGILLDDGIANDVFPNSTLELDTWYHIAVTRDTTERKLYINGKFISSGVTTGNLADMSTKYTVGNIVTGTSIDNNYLKGSLSDFRLYTSVLSADDVKELYETSVSIAHNPPSLNESAYYNYVEGQKHSTFDKSKFTVVGSPTITNDGVASGFSSSNYLKIPTINFATANSWEIVVPVKFDSVSTTQVLIDKSPTTSILRFMLHFNGYLKLYLKNSNEQYIINGDAINSVHQFTINTNYLLKIKFTGSKYEVLASTNGEDWVTEISVNSTDKTADGLLKLGIRDVNDFPLQGSIDLKQFSITVDGKEVFSGNKTGLDVIKPDNYTVAGSPVISEDGVASGFSTANYLNTNFQIGELANKSWTIKGKTYIDTSKISGIASGLILKLAQGWMSQGSIMALNSGIVMLQLRTGDSNEASTEGTKIAIKQAVTDVGWYKYKLEYDYPTGVYTLSVGKEDGDYTHTGSYTATTSNTQFIYINTNPTLRMTMGAGSDGYYSINSIDLNAFKIYVDGNLVYQPCLKIPYTESKTGIKVVDSTYLDRVKDVYDQHYLERYYTVDETTQTVYEYPLFRDSMHAYEFDEGIQASITKNGIHNATTLTEATKTSMYQNNTDTVTLIEI